VVIHPLAQGRFRRNLLKTQGFTEKVIVTVLLDRCKIALALCKQRAKGSDHICMGNAVAQRNCFGNGRGQLCKAV